MITPVLDPGFVPAALWNRDFLEKVKEDSDSVELAISISRPDGVTFRYDTKILSPVKDNVALNFRYVERLLKFLLWAKGGSRVLIYGDDALTTSLAGSYSGDGAR